MLKKLIVVVAIVFTSLLFSLNVEYENTWYRYTAYVNSIAEFDNKLYSNTYCGLEVYNVMENGDLEFDEVIEFNGVIHSLKIDQEHELLFVLVTGEMWGSYEKIYCYKLQEVGLELLFISGDPNTYYNDLDCVYTTDKYAILGWNNVDICYNFETELLEPITYNFNYIIGCFDNKLIDYNINTFTMSIYNVDEINEPTIVTQIDYTPEGTFNLVARKLDDTHVMISLSQGLAILNTEDDSNYYIEDTIYFDLTQSYDALYPPIEISDNLIYFASYYGEDFVYDLSDISTPLPVDYRYDENIRCNDYCMVELDSGKYIYKQSGNDGIIRYNVENLSTPVISYGITYPSFSSAFIQGIIYTLEDDIIKGVDPNTMNVVLQCEFPYNYFIYSSTHENMLILAAYEENYQAHTVIIDMNSGIILEDIPQPYYFIKIYKDLVFLQNSNEIIVKRLTSELSYEVVATLPASSFTSISDFDDDLLWFSYSGGNYIFNCNTYNIEQDYQSEFQHGLYLVSLIFKYDNRLVMTTTSSMDEDFIPNVKLYDIEDITNPILLDTKDISIISLYYEMEDFILETQYGEPVNVYNKFSDSFTEPIQDLDFNTLVQNLVFDPVNNRVANQTMNTLKTYTYEVTENGIIIIPESKVNLSNYPNPFNPNTTISYNLRSDTKVELEIFNIKGQKVNTFVNEKQKSGEHSQNWDGRDYNGNPVSSGVYMYKLKTDYDETISKMMLIK